MGLTVLGIGSRYSRDDQIGLILVDALARKTSRPNLWLRLLEEADFATIATELLTMTTDVLLVDCADMGAAAGNFRLLCAHQARYTIRTGVTSTHGFGLGDALALADLLGHVLPVRIFAIQPFDISLGASLSPRMKAAFPMLLKALDLTVCEMIKP